MILWSAVQLDKRNKEWNYSLTVINKRSYLDPRWCLKSPVSVSAEELGVCAHDCECVNVSGSVCDACAWGWLCTVAVAVVIVVAAAVVGGEDEDEACARCSRHGTPPLDRSSMISSSPSSTMHHPPAEKSKGEC